MAAKGARTGLPYWVVAGGFGALLALGIAAAVVIYFRLIRYERVAARHVPRDAALIVRLDVEQAIVYEPFRRHLLPLAERPRTPAQGTAPVLEPRLDRLKRHTGIELAVDIRELVVALGPTPRDWLIVLGGKFPKQSVVKGLHTLFHEEGLPVELASGERRLTLAGGAAVGQAEDGVLLFASNNAWLDAALGASQPAFALNGRQAAALAATMQGVKVLPAIWPALDPRLPAELRVARLTAELGLAAVPALQVDVRLEPGADVAAAQARLGALIAESRNSSSAHRSNEKGSASEGLRVQRAGEAELRIQGPWSRQNLDRTLASFAAWLAKAVTP
jgi:hypothetical protein